MLGFLFGLFSVGFVSVWIGNLKEEEKEVHRFIDDINKQIERNNKELKKYL